jgi:hypothetical protein
MTSDRKNALRNMKVAAPCPAKWADMEGDDRMRHCSVCDLNVHNTSVMTDEEVLQLITDAASGKRVCATLFQRDDGTLLTRNCPVGLHRLRERARRIKAWVAALVALLIPSVSEAEPKKPHWSGKVREVGVGLRGAVSGAKVSSPTGGPQYHVRMGQISNDNVVLVKDLGRTEPPKSLPAKPADEQKKAPPGPVP